MADLLVDFLLDLIVNLLVGTRCGGGVFDIIILFGGTPATTLWFSGCPDIIIGGGGGGPLEWGGMYPFPLMVEKFGELALWLRLEDFGMNSLAIGFGPWQDKSTKLTSLSVHWI